MDLERMSLTEVWSYWVRREGRLVDESFYNFYWSDYLRRGDMIEF